MLKHSWIIFLLISCLNVKSQNVLKYESKKELKKDTRDILDEFAHILQQKYAPYKTNNYENFKNDAFKEKLWPFLNSTDLFTNIRFASSAWVFF